MHFARISMSTRTRLAAALIALVTSAGLVACQSPPLAPISSEARGFFMVPAVPLPGYGTYDSGSRDEFTGVGILPDGTIVSAGYSMPLQGDQTPAGVLNSGATMVLTRPDGTAWAKTYAHDNARLYDVAISPDGTMVVTASARSFDGVTLPSDEQGGSILAKISEDGSIIWVHGFGSVFNSVPPVNVSTDGSIYVVGADNDELIDKFTPDGDLVWAKSPGLDQVNGIAVTHDGGIIAAGINPHIPQLDACDTTYTNGNCPTVVRMTSDGDIAWTSSLWSDDWSTYPMVTLAGVTVDVDGSAVVIGSTGIGSFISKLSNDGSVEWTHTFTNDVSPGSIHMGFRSIATSPQGDYIVSGIYYQCIAGKQSSALVADIDASGSILWYRCLGDGDNNSLNAVAIATDGSIAAVGTSSTLDTSNGDPNGLFTGNALLARLTSTGDIN